MLRTASIKIKTTDEQSKKLHDVRFAYVDACNKLVPIVIENRCWNRVALHNLAYYDIRQNSTLGSQMVCNAIYSVCKAYKSQKALGKIKIDKPVPVISFKNSSIHFDKRTYTIIDNNITLYTLDKRINVTMLLGKQ